MCNVGLQYCLNNNLKNVFDMQHIIYNELLFYLCIVLIVNENWCNLFLALLNMY